MRLLKCILPAFLLLIVIGCKKDNVISSDIYQQLTKQSWTFYPVRPGSVIIGVPDYSYSIYHTPPNSGAFSITGHSISFDRSNTLTFHPERIGLSYNWSLDKNLKDIHVKKSLQGGGQEQEIWSIQFITDTLLDVKVRNASESETSENYWGFKYRRP